MAERHAHGSEMIWATVAWGAAIVGGLLVGFLVGRFAGPAAGLIFGGVTFVVLGWVLSRRLGPPAEDDAPSLVAHDPAPLAAVAPAPAAAAAPAAVVHQDAAPAVEPGAVISERVRAAARAAGEAARAAAGAVPAAAPSVPSAPTGASGVEPRQPTALSAPREGGQDDLKKIKGVGPKLEEVLHSLGFWHFDQVAGWDASEIAWVDSHLEGFNGRATRDDWVGQAKILAAGGETEFSQRVDKGEVY